jgi:hypothetical protein
LKSRFHGKVLLRSLPTRRLHLAVPKSATHIYF